jgi:hypothetical protein
MPEETIAREGELVTEMFFINEGVIDLQKKDKV